MTIISIRSRKWKPKQKNHFSLSLCIYIVSLATGHFIIACILYARNVQLDKILRNEAAAATAKRKKYNEEKEATNRTSKMNQDREKEIKTKNETEEEEKNARQTNLHRPRHFTFYYVCIFRLHFTRSVIRRFCIVFLTLVRSLARSVYFASFYFIHPSEAIYTLNKRIWNIQ